jgi:hypothetical protein
VFDVGVRVADQHGAQHADVGFAQFLQRGELNTLSGAERRLDDGDRRIRGAMTQEDALRFLNLPRAPSALRSSPF